MKDSRATSWLNMGATAARAGDLADARYYLERALVSDPGLDEQAQIWYWLSRVTDDPAEKRRLLEDVIISQPGHAEARRDLAILDGRLRPEDLVDLRRPVGPRAPQEVTGRRYVCPQCGGRLAFDADRHALACAHCGCQTTDFHAPGGDDRVDEHEFLTALPTVRGHTWELPAERRLACQGCGATFALPPTQVTADCPFCGSAHVAESAGGGDLISPEAILPFAIDEEEARRRLQRWLDGQDGGPGGLKGRAAAGQPHAVYAPYWIFGIMGEVKWEGVLEARYESERRRASGAQPILVDDVLVPAGRRLRQDLRSDLLSKPGEWDLAALRPYSPDLLADWPVEIYQIPLAEASLSARQRARGAIMRAISASFPVGQSAHGLSFDSTGVVVSSFKLVLLPVWVAGYRVDDKNYAIVVNGQSGRVHGESPRRGLRRLLDGLRSG